MLLRNADATGGADSQTLPGRQTEQQHHQPLPGPTATQTLRISTEAPDVGSGEESLPVQMSGPDLELAFNVRYLLDALRVFHTQQVSLELNGATQPAIWKPLGAMRLCYLVMPVQLRAT